MDRLRKVIELIDAANAADPNTEMVDGEEVPKELAYARRMSAWHHKLAPDAPETVRIAARAQHIERWTVPRDSYPEGKKGYHRWRTDLGRFHADRTGALMAEAGYGRDEIERVQAMLQKKKLRSDPETQLLEDTICLVFLENYLAEFSAKHDDAKVVDILQKTWAKMTPRGHEAALALDMPDEARRLVALALAPDTPPDGSA